MAEILFFIPRHEADAKENLNDFIEMCRDRLTVFGAELDWNNNVWSGICSFRAIGAMGRVRNNDQFLSPDFIEFAKAYVRYKQGLNPTKNTHREVTALRCIEKALLQTKGKADITLADHHVFDCAAEIARAAMTSTAYQTGTHLVALSNFLGDVGIIPNKLSWKSPISSRNTINKTNSKALKLRAKKLPSDHCLQYMAEMFANDLQSPRDRFITSIFALLMCAPSRISEILALPATCLHSENDQEGNECLGLRFYGGKGYGSDIKYISTDFKDIATEAVRRLTELSEEGRKLAKWYEDNPNKFYRHSACPNLGETDALTNIQACQALGIRVRDANGAIRQYFKNYEPYFDLCERNEPLTLSFLNTYCRSQLPKSWPWVSKERHIKFSEALFCVRFHELRDDYITSPVLVWSPSTGIVRACLRGKKSSQSIWQRHGYRNPDNSSIEMNSHQVRHFLNTAAQRGSLGQLDIARWSGRANIHQNYTYNHVTDDEYIDQARQIGVGGVLEKIKTNAPVTFADLESVGDGIAHVTEYGFCVHDFSMLPCQKHRDCLNCSEQVCIKGDDKKLERLKRQRDGILIQLEKAKIACNGAVYGADRWSQHQKLTLERVEQLIDILERQDTPIGAIVKLNIDNEFSPLKRELSTQSESEKAIQFRPTEISVLDEIRLLMEC